MTDLLLRAWIALAAGLCLHGAHRLWLLGVWARHRGAAPPVPPLPDPLPVVTVQLPVFNERDVVARLVDAVAALDWPADRLELQLLDDSTDDTAACAASALARARARGIDARVLRRADRAGFKAGALAAGLSVARGDLVAIFDADFVPGRDFCRRLVPFFADPGVGMVQARWGHLDTAAPLAQAQAALLDGHFVIEHLARNRGGAWFNFNGTAGVWRRACIDDAGGWQHDTLTEDLDLSYRAQLRGWRFVYEPDVVVPAELPDTVAALRAQQRRWAKGSVETLRKLAADILASRHPWPVRAEALAHLGANLAWPFALLLATLMPLVAVLAPTTGTPLLLATTLTSVVFYAAAGAGPRAVLLAVALGIGLSVNQAAAVFEALAGVRTPFVRTPKNGGGRPSYRAPASALAFVEAALALAHLGAAGVCLADGRAALVPFLLLFAGGLGWVGVGGMLEQVRSAPLGGRQAEQAGLKLTATQACGPEVDDSPGMPARS